MSSSDCREGTIGATVSPVDEVDLLRPEALFERYAASRKLGEPLREAGRQLLALCGANTSLAQPPPVQLSLRSVTLHGFGSFDRPTEYQLGETAGSRSPRPLGHSASSHTP